MSNQVKHTPGPWGCAPDKLVGSYRLTAPIGERNQYSLFAMLKTIPDGSGQDLADARLIAAAPDLLRELKSAIFYIETYGGAVTANFAAGGNLTAVKTIIDKAEGK